MFLIVILVLAVNVQATELHSMTLIYSGNLDGELEPCGCTAEGDLGGIKRRVTMIDRLREKVPDLFLVCGE